MRAVLLMAATALLVSCGGYQPRDRHFSLRLTGSELADRAGALEVRRGDRVTLEVSGDAAVELHLHGYDISASAGPGTPASLQFTANATGSFPLTVHKPPAPVHEGADQSGDHDAGHDSHAETVPAPDGMDIALTVLADAAEGFNVHILPSGFIFAPERVNGTHEVGEGHAHIFLDGIKLGRVYGRYYHLTGVAPGDHEVMVTLNANSHQGYARGGEVIAATAAITAADPGHAEDAHTDDHDDAAGDHTHDDEGEATLLRLEVRP